MRNYSTKRKKKRSRKRKTDEGEGGKRGRKKEERKKSGAAVGFWFFKSFFISCCIRTHCGRTWSSFSLILTVAAAAIAVVIGNEFSVKMGTWNNE